jgi:DNA-binding NtrC family response regulator
MTIKPKVLIVDDEVEITALLSNFLSMEGYDTVTLNNPREALDVIEQESVLIVICDITMPQMNGLELLKQIKKGNGLIQVIMITGYVTIENILTAFRWGANNCFFKPFRSLDEIKDEVDGATAKLDRVFEVIATLDPTPLHLVKTDDE